MDVLPYGIKGRDGIFPLPLHGLASDEVLCEMVGELTGFSHESIILQLFTRYLLINVLEAHEKCPVTKPETKWESGRIEEYIYIWHLRESVSLIAGVRKSFSLHWISKSYRGECASAIHMRSMLQASRGRWGIAWVLWTLLRLPLVNKTSITSCRLVSHRIGSPNKITAACGIQRLTSNLVDINTDAGDETDSW